MPSDPIQTFAERDLEGAPLVPAEAREELLALKAGTTFLCARPDGDLRAGRASGEGLYARDTRHLSELRLTVGGLPPVLLSSSMQSGHHAVINATNPTLRAGDVEVPQETLNVRRTVLIADRLYYRVRVRSFRPRSGGDDGRARARRGLLPTCSRCGGLSVARAARVRAPVRAGDGVRFAYVGEDGEQRETLVELSPTSGAGRHRSGSARASCGTWSSLRERPVTLLVTVDPGHGGLGVEASGMEREATRLEQAHREWEGACSRITTDNELFDRFIDASIRDLHALMMPVRGGALPAAGIPWYVAPFGRDSLLAACESLMINPEVARGTLIALAGAAGARTMSRGAMRSRGRSCMSCGRGSSRERDTFRTLPITALSMRRRCS